MDRSLWSDPVVVEASRNFVCARLATYEDETEGKMLEQIYRGRSGELENTVFVILSPDGKKRLSNAGRSPRMVFGGASGWEGTVLALEMELVSRKYPGNGDTDVKGSPALPIAKDVRLALNIAACDRTPMVIASGLDEDQLKTIASSCWTERFMGKFSWALTDQMESLKAIGIEKPSAAIWITQPDRFGLKAEVISRLDPDASSEKIEKALDEALALNRPGTKHSRDHVRSGERLGKKWETEIPVTDPGIPPPGDRTPGSAPPSRRRGG